MKPGQGFSSVTSKLVNGKLIRSPEKFKIVGALTGDDKKIKAGEYLLFQSMTPKQIIAVLISGRPNGPITSNSPPTLPGPLVGHVLSNFLRIHNVLPRILCETAPMTGVITPIVTNLPGFDQSVPG